MVSWNKAMRNNPLEFSSSLVSLVVGTGSWNFLDPAGSLQLGVEGRSWCIRFLRKSSCLPFRNKTNSSFFWWAWLAFAAFWTKKQKLQKGKTAAKSCLYPMIGLCFQDLLTLFVSGFLVRGEAFPCNNKMFDVEMQCAFVVEVLLSGCHLELKLRLSYVTLNPSW